jgi:hypothetical protein
MPGDASRSGALEATARRTAGVRAGESGREDRLFDDPWAVILAGPEGRSSTANRPPDSVLPIVLRDRPGRFSDVCRQATWRDPPHDAILFRVRLSSRIGGKSTA